MRRLVMLFVVLVVVMAGSATLAEENPTASELEATIAALQTQVAEMQGTPTVHAFAVSGTGDGVLPPFDLAGGSYAATFTCSDDPASRPSIVVRDIISPVVLVNFDLIIHAGSDGTTNGLLTANDDARVSGEVVCTGDWTLIGDRLE